MAVPAPKVLAASDYHLDNGVPSRAAELRVFAGRVADDLSKQPATIQTRHLTAGVNVGRIGAKVKGITCLPLWCPGLRSPYNEEGAESVRGKC